VDGSAHDIAGPLIRTDGVDRVTNHKESLEGYHHLVVFDVIADKHEQFLGRHDGSILACRGTGAVGWEYCGCDDQA
jgi:hypothetical protein